MKTINIISAQYIKEYKIKLVFSDKTEKIIDFIAFFNSNSHPQWNKYKKIQNFKKFKIQNGNIV